MSSFLDVVDAPVTRQIGVDASGVPVMQSFPKWSMEDFGPWISELAEEIKKSMIAKLPSTMPAMDRAEIIWRLENQPPDPAQHLYARIITPKGGTRVLDASLERSGVADPDSRKKILKMIPAWEFQKLALEVSSLYPPSVEPEFRKELENQKKELAAIKLQVEILTAKISPQAPPPSAAE
jgi:hypothetical protein